MNDKDIYKSLKDFGWHEDYINKPLVKYYRFKVNFDGYSEYVYLDRNSNDARLCLHPKYLSLRNEFRQIKGLSLGGEKSLLLKSADMTVFPKTKGRTNDDIPEFFPIAVNSIEALQGLVKAIKYPLAKDIESIKRSERNSTEVLGANSQTDIKASEEDLDSGDGVSFQDDPEKRKCTEYHAVKLALSHYQSLGFSVEEKGKPYDLLCRNGDQIVHVEVKGTCSVGEKVILTRNEVLDARDDNWRSDLFIVRNISLVYIEENWVSSGGDALILEGWEPDEKDLLPIQFEYKVPVKI
jgi:hypothetical protein